MIRIWSVLAVVFVAGLVPRGCNTRRVYSAVMSATGREGREIMSKLALIGLVIAALGVPASAAAVHGRHSHACQSLSEMVSCGKHGVRGNRAQFVAAISRPVDNAFLWQLPH